MGMQVTFSYDDLLATTTCKSTQHEDGTWTVSAENAPMPPLIFNLYVPEDSQSDKYFCWFDCGSTSDTAMYQIKWLIRYGICFNCS
jgi:hypothetical protein